MSNPSNLKYSEEHEWVSVDGDVATVGITKYAADALGDVVFVDLPNVGSNTTFKKMCGEIESTKSVSELYAPLSGEVIEVNEAVVTNPELVNQDPFGAGWLIKVRFAELPELLDAAAYDKHIGH
ncbi:MAG: glycine cleavage system protein GcvH [Micrococcales bacterium]